MDTKQTINIVHRKTIVSNVMIVFLLPAVLVSYCGYFFSGAMSEAWLRDKQLFGNDKLIPVSRNNTALVKERLSQ